MQYLLTEEEYLKLTNANRQLHQMTNSDLIIYLRKLPHFGFVTSQSLIDCFEQDGIKVFKP